MEMSWPELKQSSRESRMCRGTGPSATHVYGNTAAQQRRQDENVTTQGASQQSVREAGHEVFVRLDSVARRAAQLFQRLGGKVNLVLSACFRNTESCFSILSGYVH